MKQISVELLAKLVIEKRKLKNLTQIELGEKTGINRQIIGRIELQKHIPSIDQLNTLLSYLEVNFEDIVIETKEDDMFLAMMGEAKTDEEEEWVKKMISMMLCIQKHERIRSAYNDVR